ncbi:unnamed protein product [Moneuplotes crassus]|uniref:Uncharacterized protein n=2 Tax=Euplotes crassus TaxID=5936 RepID=A0AAD2D0M7_EUPCR|nr:unnamed protein product [Moneuplotes crassus]
MEKRDSRNKSSTSVGVNLVHIQGFTFAKPNLYQFSPITGEFIYGIGSNIVVYDPEEKKQKEYLKNSKGLPFSCFAFSQDGEDLYTGEYMAKEACIRHFKVSKAGEITPSTGTIKTKFRTIDGIRINEKKNFLAVYGTIKNSEKRDIKKIEIFDLAKRSPIGSHTISYKIRNIVFVRGILYVLSKDTVYEITTKFKARPRIKKSLSGKGRVAMDMVDHGLKLLVILDNCELLVLNTAKKEPDVTLELPLGDVTPVSIEKLGDSLIIGCTNGAVFYSKYEKIQEPLKLPNPPFLGENSTETPEVLEYPDTRVVKAFNNKIAVLFSDKTMVWYEISENGEVSILHIIKSHFGGVYSIDCYPATASSYQFAFLTGSVDRTLRRWVANIDPIDLSCQINEDKVGLLCDNFDHLKSKTDQDEEAELGRIRTIAMSKDKDLPHVICGDSEGYMWIFDALKLSLNNIYDVHDSEILGIEFTNIEDFKDKRYQKVVTCSKDKLVKVFDAQQSYEEIKSFDYHKSAVVGVKIMDDPRSSELRIISADAKGTIQTVSVDEELEFSVNEELIIPEEKIYSMASNESSIIIGTDKKLQAGTCREDNTIVLSKDIAPKSSTPKEYIKLETDDVSLYLIACSKKKRDISFIQLKTGTVVHTVSCGEVVTGIKYSPDYKFLITSTSTGCIYIWNVPSSIQNEIKFKIGQRSLRITEAPIPGDALKSEELKEAVDPDFNLADVGGSNISHNPHEKDRKEWGNSHSKNETEPRGSMPDWARSTVNVMDNQEEQQIEDTFTMRTKDNDPFAKLKQTVTDDEEDNSEEEKTIQIQEEYMIPVDPSETQSDTDNAFNFEKAVNPKRKTSVKDLISRPSRIGDTLRNSVYERDQKRQSVAPNIYTSTVLSPEKPLLGKPPTPNIIKEDKEEDDQSSSMMSKKSSRKYQETKAKKLEMTKKNKKESRNRNPNYVRSHTHNEEDRSKGTFKAYAEDASGDDSPVIQRNSVLKASRMALTKSSKGTKLDEYTITTKRNMEGLIQENLRSAFQSIQAATDQFNLAAENGDEVSQETKDLMLILSTSISGLQFASYNALCHQKDKY